MCNLLQVEVHKKAITPKNALQLVSQYDVVLDCTDNAPTRYLISDACVVAGKPLVSGAAIGTDGQLTVYNHGEDGEHCKSLFCCTTQQRALATVACCGRSSMSSSHEPACPICVSKLAEAVPQSGHLSCLFALLCPIHLFKCAAGCILW